MRKITNTQTNALVGPRIPKVVTKRQDIKQSLSEIQKLSSQIDMQLKRNQQQQQQNKKKKNCQSSKNQYQKMKTTNSYGRELLQQRRQQQQQSEDDSGQYVSHKGKYDQNQQHDNQISNSTTIDKAVNKSILQYYLGLRQQDNQLPSLSQHILITKPINNQTQQQQLQQFNQYKLVSKFNKDFIDIKEKLQQLRRLKLLFIRGDGLCEDNNNNTDTDDCDHDSNVAMLYRESGVINMLKHIVLLSPSKEQSKEQTNFNNNNENSLYLLQCIQKLQQIKQTIQNKIQHLADDIEYKQSIMSQLQSNQLNIKDDIQIVQSRIGKLRKQLQIEINDKFNYAKKSSDEQDQEEEEQQQEEYNRHQQYQYQQQHEQQQYYQDQLQYQQQYLQLMQHYLLYNPQTQTINSTFPKNKTQAMFMLNQLDSQITQLQFKKTLKFMQNPN